MTQRLVLAIDCDDVVINTTPFIVDKYEEYYGVQVPLIRSHDPSLGQWECETIDELFARFCRIQSSAAHAQLVPRDDAMRAIRALSTKHELHLVTARHADIEHATRGMIEQYFPGMFHGIHHTGYERTKAEVCRLINADILVDDKFSNLVGVLRDNALRSGSAIHFGDYVWNKVESYPDGIVQCADWSDVEQEIDQLAR